MNLRSFFERIIWQRHDKKYVEVILFPLSLFSLLYRGVVQTRYCLYQRGILRSKKLPCKIISVGNISLGGSGKTPTTHYIAKLLKENGFRVGIVSRGYRSKRTGKVSLISNGDDIILSSIEAGDEPYMLAKKLKGIPVLTSKDRYQGGRYAIEHFNSNVLILDDGFQHIRLQRDIDILLLDSRTISGNNYLFPRGVLREPLGNLKRADVFLVTRAKSDEQRELTHTIRSIKKDSEIFYGYFQAKHLIDPFGERKGLDCLKGKRVLSFSGIANPEHFTTLLEELGAIVVKELIFPDHHWYSSIDYKRIEENSREVNFALTTEKDMVKIHSSFFSNVKTFALEIELRLEKEEEFKDFLLRRVGAFSL
ncbi:MAG: tetraacyldisaccharide 4'-kinase [Desulfobacterales bacterium]|nr:tetraacyldisaccharide 4'-kinase [Desulfobacterales bacterium]